ncbi:MAG: alpha/beta hydrolase [Pseudomonadota bacterium]
MKRRFVTPLFAFALTVAMAINSFGQVTDIVQPSYTVKYTAGSGQPLAMNIYQPVTESKATKHPTVIFFFGGGWQQGTPAQFFPFCAELVKRGMACFIPDYRVKNRQGTDAVDAIDDARIAVQWVLQHAEEYQVDTTRLYLGGGSAGGHLAAAVGLIPDSAGKTPDVAGLLLFNPAVNIIPPTADSPVASRLNAMFRNAPEKYSPSEFIRADLPDTWIIHGTADKIVPIASAKQFCAGMKMAGNQCVLHEHEEQSHGFFNHGRPSYEAVLQQLLTHLGL